jgi:hypothetical protein
MKRSRRKRQADPRAALRELKAHGLVLTPDERFGLNILRSLRRT